MVDIQSAAAKIRRGKKKKKKKERKKKPQGKNMMSALLHRATIKRNIRQAPVYPHRRTRCCHLSNNIEPSVYGGDAPYGKLL